MAVEVIDRDRRLLRVDADRARLAGRDRARHDLCDGAAFEHDRRGRGVLGLGLAVESPQPALDPRPIAEQEREQIELMDAVAQRRPAALGLPLSAPRDGEVVGIAEPQGLALGEQRPAERARVEQALDVRRRRAGALLEHDGELAVRLRAPPLASRRARRARAPAASRRRRARPAASAAMACAGCATGGVQTRTTSGFSAASSASRSSYTAASAIARGELVRLLADVVGDGDQLGARDSRGPPRHACSRCRRCRRWRIASGAERGLLIWTCLGSGMHPL